MAHTPTSFPSLRRTTLAGIAPAGAMVVLLLAAAGPSAAQTAPAAAEQALQARVARILAETPLIDGHNDLPENYKERVNDHLDRIEIAGDTSTLAQPLHTDIPRLRRGGVGGQFWSVFVPTTLEGPPAAVALFEQIDLVHRMIARYPETFAFAGSAADVERIHRSGKIASLIGIEGGYSIANSLAVLRQAYACGARYMTLTHWKSIDWADAATDAPRHDGLTRFGREVVREMNRLGMLVDLSHVSDKVMLDALATSQAPVIFSHSSARALCRHPRNVPDDILRRVAANRGIVMVNVAPGFVSEQARIASEPVEAEWARLGALHPDDPERVESELRAFAAQHPVPDATLAQVADHIEHIRKVAGVDHVGIGSDFDGIGRTPVGMEDVSKYPALLAELLRRGWSDDDVKKVAGRNILRVMHEAERVAVRLQKERPASDARIEELDATPAPDRGGTAGASE
ncbi:MAG TPA: dipeptidase [Thermoanaerobaculaceae bacterium]|nr:dipeptidase [Thermoanaerobaculaceae bacterium]